MKERGIYTAMVALLAMAMLGTTIAYILSQQGDDVGLVAGSVRDVHFSWINARHIADKTVAKAVYASADAGSCTTGSVNIVALKGMLDSALSTMGTNCTISGLTDLGTYDYSMNLACSNAISGVSFSGGVASKKSLVLTSLAPSGCSIAVSDDESGVVEVSG